MGRVRLICAECMGFIVSDIVPRDEDEYHFWKARWERRCHTFMDMNCPHHGDGAIDSKRFSAYEEVEREFIEAGYDEVV